MVDDANLFYQFCRRTLGVAAHNVHVLATAEDFEGVLFDSDEQEISQIELFEEDEFHAARLNPFGSGVIKDHFFPFTKARYNFLFNYLSQEEKSNLREMQIPKAYKNSAIEYDKLMHRIMSENNG